MGIKLEKLTPLSAIHPGEILKDELDERNIKQKDFAELIGTLPSQLSEILNGKRGINADYAVLIGEALNMDPKIWLNLQSNYELDKSRINDRIRKRVEAINQWQMIQPYIPETYLRKLGYIKGDPFQDVSEIKAIYQIEHLDQLPGMSNQFAFARYRKSEKSEVNTINLTGWACLVLSEAKKLSVPSFDHTTQNKLIESLRNVIYKNTETLARVRETLYDYGIKLIILNHPDNCAVDGFSFWSAGNPGIGLSLRFNRVDYFAFTLFHELGHIFHHLVNNNQASFIDEETESMQDQSREELEANNFAKDNLIHPEKWRVFISSSTRTQEMTILKFARQERIHPAIVKGRLSHETGNYRIKTRFENKIN